MWFVMCDVSQLETKYFFLNLGSLKAFNGFPESNKRDSHMYNITGKAS